MSVQSQLSYTNRDFESLYNNLLGLIPTLTDKWTRTDTTDPGMILLRFLAGVSDLISYTIDRKVDGLYIDSVYERRVMKKILKIIGYKLDTVISSTANEKFLIASPHSYDIPIPQYTVLSTEEINGTKYQFITTVETLIPAGQTEVTTQVREGTFESHKFQLSDIDSKGMIKLSDKNIGQGTIDLIINGYKWDEIDDVTLSSTEGRYFSMQLDDDDNVYIVLYKTWSTLIGNVSGDVIDVKYQVSSGSSGNVGTNTVTKLVDKIYDRNGNDVTNLISCSNTIQATPGADPETIEHAQQQAPQEVRTMWSLVTLKDYKALAQGYPGIAKATAYDLTTPGSGITTPYVVRVAAVSSSGTVPTADLRTNLLNYLLERRIITTDLDIEDSELISINVDVIVYAKRGTTYMETIKSNVETQVRTFFYVNNREFGEVIRLSNLISLIESSDTRISYAVVNDPISNTVLSLKQFPRLGTLSIQVLEEV